MTVFDQSFEFGKLQVVFDRTGETKATRRIYGAQCICSEDRAVAHFAQFRLRQAQTEAGEDHAQAGRDTGIFQFLAMEGGLRWHRDVVRKDVGPRPSSPRAWRLKELLRFAR